ncbi:DNA-binding NarL/FixJ family response regulator [Luteibacter jiangsuensis]|uniref:DNA-binding NarL/FixJ family response regulator n=1 Tax=Luteibacter jiangsuensis TaxID=637577 RepID=A0ABT9STT8_9GAMM|nr:response regulator transcription factor [Luteibacter jiangsuensis]MDQ0008418.1 DNA-binding NarL/FixJ family response regulator [Luteibacter jiangsuensis]
MLVDADGVFRKGLAALIGSTSGMDVVGEASTGQEAIDRFRLCQPDVTLVDLVLRDMTGERLMSAIRCLTTQARIVVLAPAGSDGSAGRALAAGAQAYLLKTSPIDELVDSIHAVHAGHHRIDADVARQLSAPRRGKCLSERELDVLRGVAAGLENKQIAQRLGLSPETIKEYLSNVVATLHASNRAHAIAIAKKRGLLCRQVQSSVHRL